MSKQQRCSECGNWYYNHNGEMIVLPDTYDDNKCPACNQKIESEIRNSTPTTTFSGKLK